MKANRHSVGSWRSMREPVQAQKRVDARRVRKRTVRKRPQSDYADFDLAWPDGPKKYGAMFLKRTSLSENSRNISSKLMSRLK